MRFLDELEQELRQGVRRQEAQAAAGRRPRLPRLGRLAAGAPAAALAAAAIAVAALVWLPSEGGREETAAAPGPLGTFVTGAMGDRMRVVLVPGGFLLDGDSIYMNGALEARGRTLRFLRPSANELPDAVGGTHISAAGLPQGLSQAEKRACLLARPAIYRWTASATELRLEVVRDSCVPRRAFLTAAPLERRGG